MNYTFEDYCSDLILIEKNQLDENLLSGVSSRLKEIINIAKDNLSDIGASIGDIVRAFKNREVFEVLKAFNFSIIKIFKTVNALTNGIHNELVKAFKEIHKTQAMKKIASGAKSLDEFLDEYPILKKLTGPIVAAMLILTWLNMTFIGNFDYDMDISHWFSAALGHYSIYELFVSPEGMAMLTFLTTGILSGGSLSVAWLGETVYNLVAAITYVAFKKTKQNPEIVNKLKRKILNKNINEEKLMGFKNFIEFEVNEAINVTPDFLHKLGYMKSISDRIGAGIAVSKLIGDKGIQKEFEDIQKFKDKESHLTPDMVKKRKQTTIKLLDAAKKKLDPKDFESIKSKIIQEETDDFNIQEKTSGEALFAEINKIKKMTNDNMHNDALIIAANLIGNKKLKETFQLIKNLWKLDGFLDPDLGRYRSSKFNLLKKDAKRVLPPDEFEEFTKAF